MALIGYPHSFLNGLSDFWQRFFSDAPQIDALYQGTAVLIGQAYLDLLTNVLGVSLKDTPTFVKEFYKLITLREDELAFDWGASSSDDRWVAALPDGVVSFLSLDNRVIEPTAALQERNDYDIDLDAKTIRFKTDPTDPNGDGTPLAGFARRALDVAVGGSFDDTTRPIGTSWMSRQVRKGDVLRLLDIGPDLISQRKRSDHPIVLVREKAFYVSVDAPLTASADPQSYVILRQPADNEVSNEALVFGGDEAPLVHTRIDVGSVRVYAKTLGGEDVVEDVDYTIDYERGILYKKASWDVGSSNLIDYTWHAEVWPNSGGSPPRYSSSGVIRSGATTARVVQMALWAPDAYVDRRTLANNFGALIGREEDSSENYRAFLRGIFQLYLLGPVLERIESAINVIVGFPVIRDDGETLVDVDTTSDAIVNRVTTRRASNNVLNVYEFPKAAPLRSDLIAANYESLTFEAFEPLTTAVTVTDYIQSPDWWHNIVIPAELFSTNNEATIPNTARRTVNPTYAQHIVGAPDLACVGDPGLLVGTDENGFQPAPGHPVFRHRLAYVLMDRFLKYHTFIVRFDPSIFSLTEVGYTRSFNDLNELVLTAKPAHTYIFTQPLTDFIDTFIGADGDYWYQPASLTADPDQPEFYLTEGEIPEPLQPYTQLGLFFNYTLASPLGGADQVLFTDETLVVGDTPMLVGDSFHYEEASAAYSFPTIGVAVPVGGSAPTHYTHRLVRIYVGTTIAGRRLVENVDYTVDYGACTVTRLTAWTSTVGVSVTYVKLNVVNVTSWLPNPMAGDTALTVGSPDPSTVTASYDPTAINWMGEAQPVTNHQDLGMVERPLQITHTGGYPESEAEMFNAVGYGTWTEGWLLEESASPCAPTFGANNLATASGTPTFHVAGPLSNFAVGLGPDGTDTSLAAASFDLAAGDDLVVAWVGKIGGLSGGTRGIMGTQQSFAAQYWQLYQLVTGAGELVMQLADGTTTVNIFATDPAHFTDTYFVGIFAMDRATGLSRMATDHVTGVAVDTSMLGSITNGQGFSLGRPGTGGADVTYDAVWIGKGPGAADGLVANIAAAVASLKAYIGLP